ncbi:MAG: hypothetical protein J6Z01_17140 [Bacteroidales bacterium]|nr:hypothetical protein [Bacteroidales bacterium]
MAKTIEDVIAENNYKLTADKIRELLSQIRESPSSSAKRWVWELLQNAKDVPNKYNKVSVEIELLSKELLEFRHNGDPFSIENVTGLVQQVSSKNSLNQEGQTGKFGTGFICTHLLSDIIDVNGVLLYNGTTRSFSLQLDRSGNSSEELLPRIKSELEKLRKIEENYPIITDYETQRTEDSFDTKFIYHLSTIEKYESAVAGLNDLINTLPITLVAQSDKIKQVRVINRINNTDITYICHSEPIDDYVTISSIKIDDTEKSYLSFVKDDISLSIGINVVNGTYELIKRDNKQPVLYRDFPLIGSEKFYFPYILNGFKFNPTEKRNGLVLNSEDSVFARENRSIIEQAVKNALEFNNWLILHNATNKYLLAVSRIPEAPEKFDDRVALPWIKGLQSSWRKALLEQHLVETNSKATISLKDVLIPQFGISKDDKELFFNIVSECFIGNGILPKLEQLQGWLDVITPEYDSWEHNLKYEVDDFLADLQAQKTLTDLCIKTGCDVIMVKKWLNKIYKLLINKKLSEKFDKYAIIPNQNGLLKSLSHLKTDSESRIPSILKKIYNDAVKEGHIEDFLIDEDIDMSAFANISVDKFGTKELISSFNSFIDKEDNVEVAYRLIALYPETSDEKTIVYRKTMYELSKAHNDNLNNFESISIGDNKDLWRIADSYWFNHSYVDIEKCQTISTMSSTYFTHSKSVDETLKWLNDYIHFYKEYGYSDIINESKVFPNQNMKLNSISDLHYDDSVEERLKDLAEFAEIHYRDILLSNAIKGYESHSPITTTELYTKIEKVFQDNERLRDSIAMETVATIPLEHQEEYAKLYYFAKQLFEMPDSCTISKTDGFKWNFAQKYYIEKISQTIAESINIEGLKSIMLTEQMSEKELILWVDSFIDFVYSFKTKRFWPIITDKNNGIGIWLNQKNEFCKFQDVCKDAGVMEELKDVALNKYVGIDYKEQLFNQTSLCAHYLETKEIGIIDVGQTIDSKIVDYKGDKQDKDFAKLVFTVAELCKRHPELENIMQKFKDNKNNLIVGSLGEGETMNIVGELIQQGDEKLAAVKRLIEGHSMEELQNGIISRESLDELHNTIVEKDREIEHLKGLIEELKKRGAKFDSHIDTDLERSERIAAQIEAQKALRQKAESLNWQWTFPKNFETEYCFTTFEVLDRNNNNIPIVLKSYKDKSKPFKITPKEWDFVFRYDAEIYVYTSRNGISNNFVQVNKKDLIKGQCVSLQFNVSNLEKEDRISALSDSLRYFSELHFDFDNFVIPDNAPKIEDIYNKTNGEKQPETNDNDML